MATGNNKTRLTAYTKQVALNNCQKVPSFITKEIWDRAEEAEEEDLDRMLQRLKEGKRLTEE